MKEVLSLPQAAKQVIHEFSHLPLGNKEINCPYHMNIRKERVGLRVLVGKGDPGEIVKEVKVWAKLKDFDLSKASSEQIRKFMIENSIGIDCSGFVAYILGYWLKLMNKKKLKEYLKFPHSGFLWWLRTSLRPLENIGANMLTSLENCDSVTDLNLVQPGDLIRAKGRVKNSHHVMMVSQVILVEGKVAEIKYVHSSRNYEDDNGIRHGKIEITDLAKPLEKQNWTETLNGKNYSLEDYLTQLEDNGIRRLKRVDLSFDRHIVE